MHPVLFYIGNFAVGTFGLMVALGFLLAIQYLIRATRELSIPSEKIYDLGLVIMIAALVGSRIFYLFVEWEWFVRDPLGLIFSRQGYVFYGGFVFAGLAVIYLARRWKMHLPRLADAIAPALALGHAIGRMGCYFNGCCHGDVCHVHSFLFRFPRVTDPQGNITGSPPYLEHLERGLVTERDAFSLPVHPTQLYEAISLLVLFFILHRLYRRKRFAPGMLFLIYAVSYAVARFAIEFFRGDLRGWIIPQVISTSQGIALVILAGAPFIYRYLMRLHRDEASSRHETHKPK